MALTAEQQQQVIRLLMKHPDRRDEILDAAGKMARRDESTLMRSLNLAGNAFMRELPLGYGDELGMSGDVGPARNAWEQGAEIVGGVAGAVPSFLGVGTALKGVASIPRVAGMLAKGAGYAPGAAEVLAQPAARLVGRDMGVSAITEGIRKPEEGRSRLTMAAKGALAGAGASGGFAAISPAITRTGANIASKYGDSLTGRAIRPAAASLGGTAGASVASLALDDEFRLDEVLMEGIGAGVFSAIDMGAMDVHFDGAKIAKIHALRDEGLKNGNLAETYSQIIEIADSDPRIKRLFQDQMFTASLEELQPSLVKNLVVNGADATVEGEGFTVDRSKGQDTRPVDDYHALVKVAQEEGWQENPLSGWVNKSGSLKSVPPINPAVPPTHQLPQYGTQTPVELGSYARKFPGDYQAIGPSEQASYETFGGSEYGAELVSDLPTEQTGFSPERPAQTVYEAEKPPQKLTPKATKIMQAWAKEKMKGQVKAGTEFDEMLRKAATEAAPALGRPTDWHKDITTTKLAAIMNYKTPLANLDHFYWKYLYHAIEGQGSRGQGKVSNIGTETTDLGGTQTSTAQKSLAEIVAEEGGIRATGGEWEGIADDLKSARYGGKKVVFLDNKSGRALDNIAQSIMEAYPGRITGSEDLKAQLQSGQGLAPIADNYFAQMEQAQRTRLSEDFREDGHSAESLNFPPGAAHVAQLASTGELSNARALAHKSSTDNFPKIRRSEGEVGIISEHDIDMLLLEKWNHHNPHDPITNIGALEHRPDDIRVLEALLAGDLRIHLEERNAVKYYNQLRDVLKGITLPIRSYFDSEGARLLKDAPVISRDQWQGLVEVGAKDYSPDSPVHQQLLADGLIVDDGDGNITLTDSGDQTMYGIVDFTSEYGLVAGSTVRMGDVQGVGTIDGDVTFHPESNHIIDADNNVVFDGDPDIADVTLKGVRMFETDLEGGGLSYVMQPGDRLVKKNPMQSISFKMGMMQHADGLVNTKRLQYRDIYDSFIADAKKNGWKEGEAWAMISDQKRNDIYDAYLNDRSERLDSEKAPRISMLDILHQRDGIKTMDDLDVAIADGRVPEWFKPHVDAFTVVNKEFADAATAAKLEIRNPPKPGKKPEPPRPFMPRDIYAPMFYDPKRLADQSWLDKQVGLLMKEHDGMTKSDAEGIVALSSNHNNPRVRRSGNLERTRDMVPQDGYLINPEIMWGQYSYRNANRILRAHLFGANDEVAENLLKEARVQGASETAIDQYFRFAGREDRGNEAVADVLAGLNQFTALTRMTMSYLPQMLQLNNTAAIAGYKNTFKGLANAMRGASKEQREDIGASFIEHLNGLMVSGLDVKPNAKMMKYAPHLRMFAHTDQFIRDISGLTAVPYMNDIGRALETNPRNAREINKLRELGVDPGEAYRAYRDRAAKPAAWDKIVNKAGLQLSNKTQFLNRSENLPHFWQSPVGRAATMFKGFLLMQTRFMRDLTMPDWSSFPKALRGKNNQGMLPAFTRLIMFPAMALVGGEIVNDIKGMMGARRRPDELGERLLHNMMTAGSAGIAIEMMRSMSEGRVQAFETIMGPSLSGVIRTASDGLGMGARIAKDLWAGNELEWNKIVGPTVRNVGGQAVGPMALLAQHYGLGGKALQIGLAAAATGQQTAGRILAPPQQTQYQAVPLDGDYAETVLTGQSSEERLQALIKQLRRLRGNRDQMEAYGF